MQRSGSTSRVVEGSKRPRATRIEFIDDSTLVSLIRLDKFDRMPALGGTSDDQNSAKTSVVHSSWHLLLMLGMLAWLGIGSDPVAAQEMSFESTGSTSTLPLPSQVGGSDPLSTPLAIPKPEDAATRRTPFALPEGMAQNTMLALMVVVGSFLVIAWFTKKTQPRSMAALPKEAVELLGRVSIDSKQYLQLIRLGRKLVLVNVNSQGVTRVSEVDEPGDVEHVLQLCRSKTPHSSLSQFREAIRMEELAPTQGFLEPAQESTARGNRRRVWSAS